MNALTTPFAVSPRSHGDLHTEILPSREWPDEKHARRLTVNAVEVPAEDYNAIILPAPVHIDDSPRFIEAKAYLEAASSPWEAALYKPVLETEALESRTAAPKEQAHLSLTAIRVGLAALVGLITCGLLILSFAIFTGAGPLLRGAGIVSVWAGLATFVVAAHLQGKRLGVYLLGEHFSFPVAVAAVGMACVAVVATIEFSVR